MTLFDRLAIYRIVGSNRVRWKFKGEVNETLSNLIDLVLERYARRFGFVEENLARDLQEKLVFKYNKTSLGRNSIINSLRGYGGSNVYPIKEREKIDALDDAILESTSYKIYKRFEKGYPLFIGREVYNIDGDFCITNKNNYKDNPLIKELSESTGRHSCYLCGKQKEFHLMYKNEGEDDSGFELVVIDEKTITRLRDYWTACKRKICRATIEYASRKPRQKARLIDFLYRILLEISKNSEKSAAQKKRLKKHLQPNDCIHNLNGLDAELYQAYIDFLSSKITARQVKTILSLCESMMCSEKLDRESEKIQIAVEKINTAKHPVF